ncbi:MAG: gluconeogenesis factor YvcK family protein [Actinomycetota bacterium]
MKKNIKVAGIGGGTGLSTLLEGIKHWTGQVTAIVTVTDDGGSSGRLRKDFNMLPPGDIRNCIVSLADSNSLLSELFQYRFKASPGLSGHSFGNLLIAAMSEITGSFAKGILEASHILNIKGKVLPSTLENVVLGAEFDDGAVVHGQTKIVSYPGPIRKIFLLPQNPRAYTGVIKACREADIIILGPGSLFSSIIPNLLVEGVAKAIQNSKAKKVYVCNIMTQPGETDGFSAADHLLTVEKYLGCCIDYILLNSAKIPDRLLKKHSDNNSFKVINDIGRAGSRVKVISREILSDNEFIRHDPLKTAEAIFENTL